jgi:hypothetical protein
VKDILAKDCRDLMRLAGIPAFYGVATIRHAAITFWIEMGISMKVVMIYTGHCSGPLVRKFYDKSKIAHDMTALFLKLKSDEDIPAGEDTDILAT